MKNHKTRILALTLLCALSLHFEGCITRENESAGPASQPEAPALGESAAAEHNADTDPQRSDPNKYPPSSPSQAGKAHSVSAPDFVLKPGAADAAEAGTIYKRIYSAPESFTYDNAKGARIRGAGGTVLDFASDNFLRSDGKPFLGTVRISLEEYIEMDDILLAGLSTLSNGHWLETAGMIKVEAFDAKTGEALQLNGEYTLTFPEAENRNGFRLFSGSHDEAGRLNWDTLGPDQNKAAATVGPLSDAVNVLMPATTQSFNLLKKIPADYGEFDMNLLQNAVKENHLPIGIYRFAATLDSAGTIIAFTKDKGPLSTDLIGLRNALLFKSIWTAPKGISVHSGKLTFSVRSYGSGLQNLQTASLEIRPRNLLDAGTETIVARSFRSQRLGWINCDRFQDEKRPLILASGEDPQSLNSTVYAVLSSYRSVIPADKHNGKYLFPSLPQGEKVTLIGIIGAKENLGLAKTEFTAGREAPPALEYVKLDEAALREALNSIE